MLKKVICASKNKNQLFRASLAAALSIILVLGATGCSKADLPSPASSAPSEAVVDPRPGGAGNGTLDMRASAGQSFGGEVLVNVLAQSQPAEPEDVLALIPGDTIMSLAQFMAAFSQAKTAFQEHLMSALNQAGLQTSADNEVIRLDPLGTAGLFAIFAAWEDGPEATLALWNNLNLDVNWTVSFLEEENDWIHFLFYKDEVPAAEFFGRWFEGNQYLFCIYRTVDYTLEMDVLRTDYGFACQLYEPDTPALYRLSFTNDGAWDGGIGYTFAMTDQPDVLIGTETLTYAMGWPEADMMQTSYILIEGTVMTVAQSGGAFR